MIIVDYAPKAIRTTEARILLDNRLSRITTPRHSGLCMETLLLGSLQTTRPSGRCGGVGLAGLILPGGVLTVCIFTTMGPLRRTVNLFMYVAGVQLVCEDVHGMSTCPDVVCLLLMELAIAWHACLRAFLHNLVLECPPAAPCRHSCCACLNACVPT